MKDENLSAENNVRSEISRIAEVASGMFLQLQEFTRQHGNQVLLGQPLSVDAATELACIVSDCRTVSEALNNLLSGPFAILVASRSRRAPPS
jgi:hypothetical protein